MEHSCLPDGPLLLENRGEIRDDHGEFRVAAPERGLSDRQRALADAPRVLAPGGAIGLEIDPSQAQAVLDLARAVFPEAAITVLHDLAGHARHVIIETEDA